MGLCRCFLPLFLITVSFINIKLSFSAVIILPDETNYTLQDYLCDDGTLLESNTTIILQSNVSHIISPTINTNDTTGSVCVIANLSDISIIANNTDPVTVSCVGTYLATRQGFLFHNVTRLTINGVKFKGCGGILDEKVSFVNGSYIASYTQPVFYFGMCQMTSIGFHNCNDLTLVNVQVEQYGGFGIMILDSFETITLHNINVNGHVCIQNAPHYCYPSINSGSGLFIYYHTTVTLNPKLHAKVDVTNCNISDGYTNNNGDLFTTINSFYTKFTKVKPILPFPIISAAGLTVIIREDGPILIDMNFNMLHITNNTGFQAGGTLILYLDVKLSDLTFDNIFMKDNCVIDPIDHYNYLGRSIMVYFLSVLSGQVTQDIFALNITNATIGGISKLSKCFVHQSPLGSYADVVIWGQPSDKAYSYSVALKDIIFKSTIGSPNRAAAVALYVNSITGIELTNIETSNCTCYVNNSLWSCTNFGVMAFAQISNVSIIGGRFQYTTGSSVIYSKYSSIELSQDPIFSYNHAGTYGAISLMERSYLVFVEPLHVIFKSNKALLGAAIFGVEDNVINCALQFTPAQYYDVSNYTEMNITIEMEDNSAELAGNDLYSSPIKRCVLRSDNLDPVLKDNISMLIESTFVIKKSTDDYSNNVQDISSTPSLVCDCHQVPTPCKSNFTTVHASAHPGQKVTVTIAAFDVEQKVSVYSLITAQLYGIHRGAHGITSLHLDSQEVITRIEPDVCTTLFYTIYHSISNTSLYPISDVQLSIAPYTETPRYVINLTLVGCPVGFYQANSSCKCVYKDPIFNLSCNNQDSSVIRPRNSWIGRTNFGCSDGSDFCHFGYSSQCPPSYCNATITRINLTDTIDGVCYGNRTGTLCGSCPEGLSVVFGTAECKECSNAYLATIIVYAVAGILLVFFMFLLQMTLATGTINGLIFYVNILGSTDGYLFGHQVSLYYLKIFVALLNLELGFPLCFYHGMTEIGLRCLQFVFPIYIWTIVIVIIILSHYSSRLAKITGKQSVAVLATLIYLSYSKISISIVNTFTSATVTTEDGNHFLVWYFHGHLEFGRGYHLLPMLLSLVMLCLFVIPFTIVTTLSPFLNRFRIVNRFMPLTDAVFAPYKDKWRFWFGARLCLLIISFIIAAVLRGSDVKLSLGLQHILIAAFSFVQAFVHPFKNRLIAILDLSFMINYSLLAFVAVYTQEQNSNLYYASQMLVSLALIVFICIVVYHCYKVIRLCVKTSRGKALNINDHSINVYGSIKTTQPTTHSEIPEVHEYNEYREPLLSEIKN